jgi:hypothetical protein
MIQHGGECGRSTYQKNGLYKIAKNGTMKIKDYTMNVDIKSLMQKSWHRELD